jgi:hypothetical protein
MFDIWVYTGNVVEMEPFKFALHPQNCELHNQLCGCALNAMFLMRKRLSHMWKPNMRKCVYFLTFRLFRRDFPNRRARSYTLYRIDHSNRCSDNCFSMRDLAEIWANALDHDINNFSSWWNKIRARILELEDSPQNWRIAWKKPTARAPLCWPPLLSINFWMKW